MFIVLHNPGLAPYFIPIDLCAKFGVLVFKTDLRARIHERLRRSDEGCQYVNLGGTHPITWLNICN